MNLLFVKNIHLLLLSRNERNFVSVNHVSYPAWDSESFLEAIGWSVCGARHLFLWRLGKWSGISLSRWHTETLRTQGPPQTLLSASCSNNQTNHAHPRNRLFRYKFQLWRHCSFGWHFLLFYVWEKFFCYYFFSYRFLSGAVISRAVNTKIRWSDL